VALVAVLVAAEWLVAGQVNDAHAAGVPAPGYAVTDFATGFGTFIPFGPGPIGVAFDAAGNLYSTAYFTGGLYRFPPAGGTFETAQISSVGFRVTGLAFDKSGRLFVARQGEGDVLELDPATGAIKATVASGICNPNAVVVDPLSGDLFVSSCGTVQRLSGYQGSPVTPTLYTSNVSVDGLTFGPDGTLYGAGGGPVYRITGTADPSPGTASVIASVPTGDGIALVAPATGSPITQLAVNRNDGIITLVDFSVQPVTYADIVTGGSRGDFVGVGPDKCLYATQSDEIEKVTAADGSCPFLPTGVSKPRPNPPQKVTNIGTSAGNVLVAWQPPVPNGAILDHYNVIEIAFGGQPRGVVAKLPATATDLSSIIQNLNLCTYYTFGVTVVGSDGQESTIALPAKQAFTQGSPKSPPTTVAILVSGINTDIASGTFNPLDVFDYCTTLDGLNPNSANSAYPAPLAGMNRIWNMEDDPQHSPGFGAGNRMIDTIASKGAIVLPFSYTHATLTGPASAPIFRFEAFDAAKIARTFPDAAAATLNDEIRSVHGVWPDARIVVVGHSNGGLVSELWWILYGSKKSQGVVQVFSLDSPLNGILSDICTTFICGPAGVGKQLADTYNALWLNQATLDPRYVNLDEKNNLFTPIGTVGDPVYDPPDFSINVFNKNGLLSQLYFSEPSCAKSGFDLASSACSLVGKDFLDPCGPLDDGGPPLFGVPGSLWLHSVVKNCPGVIAKVMLYVQ